MTHSHNPNSSNFTIYKNLIPLAETFFAGDDNVSFIPTEELNSSTTANKTDLQVQLSVEQSAEVVKVKHKYDIQLLL